MHVNDFMLGAGQPAPSALDTLLFFSENKSSLFILFSYYFTDLPEKNWRIKNSFIEFYLNCIGGPGSCLLSTVASFVRFFPPDLHSPQVSPIVIWLTKTSKPSKMSHNISDLILPTALFSKKIERNTALAVSTLDTDETAVRTLSNCHWDDPPP